MPLDSPYRSNGAGRRIVAERVDGLRTESYDAIYGSMITARSWFDRLTMSGLRAVP